MESWQGQAAGAISVVGKAVLTLYPPLRPLSHNVNPRDGAQDIPIPPMGPSVVWGFFSFFSKPLRLRNDANGAPLAVLLQLKIRNPNQTIASTSILAPVAMHSPCQSRRSGFGSWHQWAMKTAATALAVTRARSKGQQGPARRSTIAKFDHPFCVYVLRPPNCSTSQFIATGNSSKPPDSHCAPSTIFHLRPK